MDSCLCFFILTHCFFMMPFIETRQLKKMIRQLEEEVEQKKAPVILFHRNEGEK